MYLTDTVSRGVLYLQALKEHYPGTSSGEPGLGFTLPAKPYSTSAYSYRVQNE